jgi:putative ABC transport system ATP-binding protein
MKMPAHTMTPCLRAVGLTRTFSDGTRTRTALDNVSVDLFPGQLALLMGPSGSGKSTLLAVLSGLLPPDAGQVIANTRDGQIDVWGLPPAGREAFRRAHVGFIFQGYNLFPALSAVQQLELVLKWGEGATPSDARKRATDMLDKLGLADQRKKKPAQLSGGEKQRVAIGRALVKDPAFLFADEPTSALDWENGRQVIALLRDAAHTSGTTSFVVSHDERMLPYVDVCYYLNNGQLETRPLPAEVAR